MGSFFPDNGNRSRVVVTTRLSNLGSQLDNYYCLNMNFLDDVSSWNLFSETVFGKECCPTELREIGKKIIETCQGLPLSIVVMGGLFKNLEHTQECWESIWKNSSFVVNSVNEDYCLKILKMSYNHLPAHLKPCFLYMGVFEEDRTVLVSTLIKLWICEGFVKPVSDKSLETAAKEYLNDLVDRNLILVHEFGSIGNIKYCEIHDVLRDLCWREAEKEGFYIVIGQHKFQGLKRFYDLCLHKLNSQRRVVIRRSSWKEEVDYALRSMPLARSFLCDTNEVLPLPKSILLRIVKGYDRDSYGSCDYKLEDLFGFVNSRFLAVGVEYGKSGEFPSSVSLLWNLQTLIILQRSAAVFAPDELWKMPQLRHVECHEGELCLPDPPSGNTVIMKNLQTLKGVCNLKCEEASKIIPNIKKLGVVTGITSNLICLSKLESYRCSGVYNPKCSFPYSLKKLCLGSSTRWELNEEILRNISALPLLQKLKLALARFPLQQWETSEDQFPSLKYLELKWCHLESWMTESSHFPRLEKLHLYRLEELEEIPSEIGEISTLQTILMKFCSETVVKSAKKITEEQEDLRVRVVLFNTNKNQALRSLATPNFLVEIVDYV